MSLDWYYISTRSIGDLLIIFGWLSSGSIGDSVAVRIDNQGEHIRIEI